MDPITIDFETDPIEGNPLVNPPRPIGYAILIPGSEPIYYQWGGREANIDYHTARTFLEKVWFSTEPLLFHNAPFDCRVAEHWFDLYIPYWGRIHDTQYQIFLDDPYAASLALKPSAQRYLGVAPDEQDELHEWIVRNVEGATKKTAGAFINQAPLYLVEKYAKGDVVRTRDIFHLLRDKVPQEPYDRERKIMPILVNGTRRGVRVDRGRLEEDLERATKALEQCAERVRGTLAAPNLNIASTVELAQALLSAGAVTHLPQTEKGNPSVAKDVLVEVVKDPELLKLLIHHSSLETVIGTFMRPWLEMSAPDGRLHPNWNQVRSSEGKRKGTRTGRLSSDNPNLQNVPTEFTEEVPADIPPIPRMRQYLLPEEGHVWAKRDFSSQEVRILAHFEDGQLLMAYVQNPLLDPHSMGQGFIKENTGVEYPRKDVKITGFSIIYGSGVNGLASQLHRSSNEAWAIREAYFQAFPGIKQLMRDTQAIGQSGRAIRTWGGRLYHREPSKDGRDFSYKLLNYLIQGSAADQTKECLYQWHYIQRRPSKDVFLATVHDEINISVPADDWQEGMARLKHAMEDPLPGFDCPMRSEGFVGKNWHDIEECE